MDDIDILERGITRQSFSSKPGSRKDDFPALASEPILLTM